MSDSSSGSARKKPRSPVAVARSSESSLCSSSQPATERRAIAAAIGVSHRCSASLYGRITGASAASSRDPPRATLRDTIRGRPDASRRTAPNPPRRIRVSDRPSSVASPRISCCASSIMSPPASACCRSAKPSRIVHTRPPTRSRASTTVTAAPVRRDRARPPARPDRRRRRGRRCPRAMPCLDCAACGYTLAMLPLLVLAAMTYAHPEQLVDTDWVAQHAGDANVRIVDMRQSGYAEGHVPGAVYLSPVAIRDAKAAPTFLPTPAAFQEQMAKLGISDTTRVVVYDERGGIYAARLWWILNYFGHPNVALVNGGWIKWSAEHRSTSTDRPAVAAAGAFTPSRSPGGWRRHRMWLPRSTSRRSRSSTREPRTKLPARTSATSGAAGSSRRRFPCTGKI